MYRAIAANKRNTVVIIFAFVLLIGGSRSRRRLPLRGGMTIFFGTLIGATVYVLFPVIRVQLAGAPRWRGPARSRSATTRACTGSSENLAITEGMPMPKVLHRQRSCPQRLRHRARPPSMRVFARDHGSARSHERSRAHRRYGARAGPREELRHSRLDGLSSGSWSWWVCSPTSSCAWRSSAAARNNGGNPIVLIFGLVAMIVAPLVASLIQAAVSRQREYLADATGALTTRDPEALASGPCRSSEGDYARPMRQAELHDGAPVDRRPHEARLIDRMFQSPPPDP